MSKLNVAVNRDHLSDVLNDEAICPYTNETNTRCTHATSVKTTSPIFYNEGKSNLLKLM